MAEGFPDGLLEYRKKLHSLLHNKDPKERPRTTHTPPPPAAPTSKVRFPNLNNTPPKSDLQSKISTLENTIDLKNKKIVSLSKSNLSKVEIIKSLNMKINKLQNQNLEKDAKIEELQRIIVQMQSLTQNSDIEEEQEREEEVDTTADFDSDLHLDTQQLLNLDLQDLTFHQRNPPTSRHNSGVVSIPSAYNSNKMNDDLDDDLDEYLFEI